jgi:4-hydroxy-2-oxoheptanedioate aldolase
LANSPLLNKLREGGTALGIRINSADMIDLCGHLGFDWFVIDQMFSANDWGRTEDFMRAGEAAGITPVVRVQANPWVGYDHRLAIEVSRALGIGMQFVMVSNSCKKEIDECIEVSKGWHRKAMIIHPHESEADWVVKRPQIQNYIIPQPESTGALADLEDTIKHSGVKAVHFAMSDAVMAVTGEKKPNWYHPKIWDYVDRVVALGKQYDCVIGANTSYGYDMGELVKRVRHLHEHGVRMIQVQSVNFIFQIVGTKFLRELDPILK